MKRDWELIRALLLEIEALGHGQHFHPQPLAGHGLEMVSHNLHLMCQAGLAECTPHHPWNGDPVMIAKGLTLAGHDLLDLIRDEGAWRAKRQFIEQRMGGVSLETLRSTAIPPAVGDVARQLRLAQNDAQFS
ncbi:MULTISPECIES: DUF2513 domain-containing protein [Pseudomonas]|jgi:hypothetical protein|uniref:DUF2513 domain-containing protein n=1 Tax=Pseudomonas TaxID=286 RepID=UPI0013145BDE|nr:MULTISPECIES: DUF2513 domain-containing protein [Pseudomonas]MDW3711580.1 DUF2513 domain-containing protein [Pseudomonas sp. 2023EL-01195]